MEFLKRALLILTAVLVVGTIALTTGANLMARSGVTKALGNATDMQVDIRSARLGLFTGGRFNNISIQSAEDDDSTMWRAEWMQLDASPESLTHKTVQAKTLKIQGVSLLLDRSSATESNYQALLKHWKETLKAASGTAEAEDEHNTADKADDHRLYVIEEIVINGLTTRGIDRSAGQGPSDVSIKTESIKLTEVGSEKNGISLTELSSTVLFAVLHHVAHRERALPPQITRELRLALRRLPQPDAVLQSRPRSLGEQAGDQGQAFFDRAIEAIDKFMDNGPAELPAPGDENKSE